MRDSLVRLVHEVPRSDHRPRESLPRLSHVEADSRYIPVRLRGLFRLLVQAARSPRVDDVAHEKEDDPEHDHADYDDAPLEDDDAGGLFDPRLAACRAAARRLRRSTPLMRAKS